MSEEKRKVEITDLPFVVVASVFIVAATQCSTGRDIDRLADAVTSQVNMTCSISRNGVTYSGVAVCATVARALRERPKQ